MSSIRYFSAALFVLITYGQGMSQDFERLRHEMVSQQLEPRGINNVATLGAMRSVERHLFVTDAYQQRAYQDKPLPIGYGQTISQPFIVALMTQMLNPKSTDRILEIGTGSGYQAAVLGEIVAEVYTIEIVEQLGRKAKALMDKLAYSNVEVIIGDGYNGYEEKAPFDAIIVTAAPEETPQPLIEQLKDGGKIIIPVGPPGAIQNLVLIEKRNGELVKTSLTPVRFVPFTRNNNINK